MSFLGRKNAAKPARKPGAPTLELLYQSEESSKALAVGLQWKKIATANGRKDAIAQARQGGATHYIFLNQQLGMGAVPPAIDSGLTIYPASLAAARQLPGTALVALQLAEDEFWICEVHGGQPTTTDRLMRGIDEAEVLAQVRALLEEREGFGTVTVYTNIPDHGLDAAKPFQVEDLFAAVFGAGETLAPIPRAAVSIPKPVLYVAALGVVILLVQHGMSRWEKYQRTKAAELAQSAEVDPHQAWTEAIAQWQSTIAAPRGSGLLAARAALDKLPVEWHGWRLVSASCNAAPPAGTTRSWGCSANYKRETTGVFNRDIGQVVPAGWNLVWEPLGGMQLNWSVNEPAQPIDLAKLRKLDYYNVEVASRLQQLLPAFAGEVSFAFAPVTVPAPKKRDGSVLPPDPRVEGILTAPLAIKAPLRSIDALIAAQVDADWRVLNLVNQGTPDGRIKTSALMAEVKGDLYAKR